MDLPKINLTKTHWTVLGVLALVILLWRVYVVMSPPPARERALPVVRTVTLADAAAENSASYPGEVRGKYETELAFQVAGKIISRSVNLGDSVRAGEVLMTLDTRDVEQTLTEASAQVASAQASFRLAEDNLRRFDSLLAQGAVSRMTYDQYKTQYDAAAAALNSAQAQLNAAQNQMEYTQLKADHDGSVSSLTGEVGMVVSAGTPVASLVRDEGREVQIYVPENRLGEVHPAQSAEVTFWALDGVRAQGVVTEIARTADSVTRTYRVRVAVENFPTEARLGMTAKVKLAGTQKSALTLPTSAVYQTQDKPHVWVVEDGKVHLREVELGDYEGSDVQIKSGLKAGDVVVTGGANKLSEGEAVQPEQGGGIGAGQYEK